MSIELMIQSIKLPAKVSSLFEDSVNCTLSLAINPLMQNYFYFKRQSSICNKSLSGCDQILNARNHRLKT